MTTRKHILIIDDEENLRHMLSLMLAREGYRTQTAADGAEGLRCVRENVHDFILCDIRMPEMDGKTFLTKVLEERVNSPIIMMSAYATVEFLLEAVVLVVVRQ